MCSYMNFVCVSPLFLSVLPHKFDMDAKSLDVESCCPAKRATVNGHKDLDPAIPSSPCA